MSYTFKAEPRVVKQKAKFRNLDPTTMTPNELEKKYVAEMEEKYKIESMEK
jgi:hypothetical protein